MTDADPDVLSDLPGDAAEDVAETLAHDPDVVEYLPKLIGALAASWRAMTADNGLQPDDDSVEARLDFGDGIAFGRLRVNAGGSGPYTGNGHLRTMLDWALRYELYLWGHPSDETDFFIEQAARHSTELQQESTPNDIVANYWPYMGDWLRAYVDFEGVALKLELAKSTYSGHHSQWLGMFPCLNDYWQLQADVGVLQRQLQALRQTPTLSDAKLDELHEEWWRQELSYAKLGYVSAPAADFEDKPGTLSAEGKKRFHELAKLVHPDRQDDESLSDGDRELLRCVLGELYEIKDGKRPEKDMARLAAIVAHLHSGARGTQLTKTFLLPPHRTLGELLPRLSECAEALRSLFALLSCGVQQYVCFNSVLKSDIDCYSTNDSLREAYTKRLTKAIEELLAELTRLQTEIDEVRRGPIVFAELPAAPSPENPVGGAKSPGQVSVTGSNW